MVFESRILCSPKVVVPHAGWAFEKLVAVALQYDDCALTLHRCAHEHSYYELLLALWREGETFILVEHDIIPWPGAVTELNDCAEQWCLFPYNVHTDTALGCTKFSAVLLAEFPDALAEPFHKEYDKHWSRLDWFVADKLSVLGVRPHRHRPNVAHLHAHQYMRKEAVTWR